MNAKGYNAFGLKESESKMGKGMGVVSYLTFRTLQEGNASN